jgi:capsular exopolysaccharide synthesis family protein
MKQFAALPTSHRDEPENDEIDLGQLFRTLWRGKFWIALSGLLAVLTGAWYSYGLAVPKYTANATVALESREQQVMDIENVVAGLGGDQSTINTEVEVLKSRSLLEQLVIDQNLTTDPEFNPRLRPEPEFSIGQAVALLREIILGPQPEPAVPSDRAILDRAIDKLLSSISVSNVRQSYVFDISVVTEDPEKSARIANRLAELYINDQIAVKFEKTEQATLWLSERVSELQAQLESAQAQLKEFSANADLVSPETLSGLNRQIKELRERRASTAAQVEAAEARLAQLEAAEDQSPAAFAAAADDSALNQVLKRVEAGMDGALGLFESRAETILTRADLEIRRGQAQLAALERSIDDVEAQIATQSQELVRLQQLEREAEASRLLYEAFLSRLKETSIQQGIQQADSRVLSYAVVPSQPSAPRKARILALSLLLGLMAGAGGVLAREMMQNTFRVPEDLESGTGYAVIGQIPKIPARKRRNVLEYLSVKPNSAAAEAVRNLRTSMLLANIDSPPKVIMSTSSVPGEGKTTHSLALAQNLSGLGGKVLLVEGDIRRRVLSEYIKAQHEKGFLSVLSGDASLDDVVVYDGKIRADVLFGEKSPINAADLFSSARFAEFVSDLRERYDYIIIDTPPVLAVPDARVIGQFADAIIYAVKWDSTSRRQVLDGLKSFEGVKLRVTGLVLSQIDPKGLKRYGYGNSYSNYRGYYES